MNENINKLIAMADDKDRTDCDFTTVSQENRQKIDDAIDSVFQGRSILRWIQGGTLENAWTTTLDALREELFSIPNTSAVISYLRCAVFAHRQKWQAKITQSTERKSIAQMTDTERKEITEYANGLVVTGTKNLNEIIGNNDTGTVRTQHEKQNQMQNLKIHENTNNREHEYERTRK